jgi:hypothetical protein
LLSKNFEKKFLNENKKLTERYFDPTMVDGPLVGSTNRASIFQSIMNAFKTSKKPKKPKKLEKEDIRDKQLKDKCLHCFASDENFISQECTEWFTSDVGGLNGVIEMCLAVPESPYYESPKRVKRGCRGCLASSGKKVFQRELSELGVKRLPKKISIKMLQLLLNYVNPDLKRAKTRDSAFGKITDIPFIKTDGKCGNNTRKAIQFFQEKTPGLEIDQCAGSGTVKALLKMYFKKHKGSNISYLYRDAARAEGTIITSAGQVLPAFGRLPKQLHTQLKHIEQYMPFLKDNFILVDDLRRVLYVFKPNKGGEGVQLIDAMAVMTGQDSGDLAVYLFEEFLADKGLAERYKWLLSHPPDEKIDKKYVKFAEQAFEAYLAEMDRKLKEEGVGSKVTPSGVYDIASVFNLKKDPMKYGSKYMLWLQSPNPLADQQLAIHGMASASRQAIINKAKKIFDLDPLNPKVPNIIKVKGSYGCINIDKEDIDRLGKLITKGSAVFILPEDQTKIVKYDNFVEFKKVSDKATGLLSAYKKKHPTDIARIMAMIDKTKVEQIDPEDEAEIEKRKREAGFGTSKFDPQEG